MAELNVNHMMNARETVAFSIAEMRNEKTLLSDEAHAFMDDRTRLHLRDLLSVQSFHEAMRPTREAREIKARLQASLLDRIGARDDFERLRQLAWERIQHGRDRPRVPLLDGPGSVINPPSAPGADEVEVWWAKTTWFWPSTKASIWMDGSGVHIAAKFELDDGDLHNYSIRVVAQFEVTADRMPPRGRIYASNPVSEVLGKIYGYTLPNGLFDFGDNWSKCWLNTRQTVFTHNSSNSVPFSRRLVFIEDHYPEHVDLPGIVGMPITFFVSDPTDKIIIELMWEFHVQMEGEAGLWLGHQPGADFCTISHPQWTIRGI